MILEVVEMAKKYSYQISNIFNFVAIASFAMIKEMPSELI